MEELWDLYPFFRPDVFNTMYTASIHAKGSDQCYFGAIFDALTSLAALYLGDYELSQRCYQSAQDKLHSPNNESPRVEGMNAYIVLVLILVPLGH